MPLSCRGSCVRTRVKAASSFSGTDSSTLAVIRQLSKMHASLYLKHYRLLVRQNTCSFLQRLSGCTRERTEAALQRPEGGAGQPAPKAKSGQGRIPPPCRCGGGRDRCSVANSGIRGGKVTTGNESLNHSLDAKLFGETEEYVEPVYVFQPRTEIKYRIFNVFAA